MIILSNLINIPKVMDLDKLRGTYKYLLSHMEARKMDRSTITRTKSMCEHILEHEGEFSSYPEYYEKFIDSDGYHKSNDKSRHLRSIWRSIWAFDEYDHLPDGKWFNPVGMSHRSENKLNNNLRTFLDKEVIPSLNPDMLVKTSVNNLTCIMAKFLLAMQERGATTLHKINEERILSYFYKDGKQVVGLEVGRLLSMMFGRIDTLECKRIKGLIPELKRTENKFTPITDEVIEAVKEALSVDDPSFSLRDRALITIEVFTGLRAVDIANLTIDSVDWDRDLISIVQSKTQQRLVLPLRAVVGNALYNYIKEGKFKLIEGKYLFYKRSDMKKKIPHREVGRVIEDFFKRTGLLDSGKQRRIRIFRHKLASSLLKNGTSIEVVRSILGHSTRKAINAYFDVDIEDIRGCSLDISDFPPNDDIFDV